MSIASPAIKSKKEMMLGSSPSPRSGKNRKSRQNLELSTPGVIFEEESSEQNLSQEEAFKGDVLDFLK